MYVAVDETTGQKWPICDEYCAGDISLTFLPIHSIAHYPSCEFCAACGTKVRGGRGEICMEHDEDVGSIPGTWCPMQKASGTLLFSEVLIIVARQVGEISNMAWELVEFLAADDLAQSAEELADQVVEILS